MDCLSPNLIVVHFPLYWVYVVILSQHFSIPKKRNRKLSILPKFERAQHFDINCCFEKAFYLIGLTKHNFSTANCSMSRAINCR